MAGVEQDGDGAEPGREAGEEPHQKQEPEL